MNRLTPFASGLWLAILAAGWGAQAAEAARVDLTLWTPPDIGSVGSDPFGQAVRYGYALFTDTANQIGPQFTDAPRRFAGNNLACSNCHLRAGTQPYAAPMTGIWGQFPQYRAREGRVDTLADRINGCLERSMNGRPLPLDSAEMTALSSYMRWLSAGIPAGAALTGAGTLRINEPARAADPVRGAAVFTQQCAPCHGGDGSGRRSGEGAGYDVPPLWGPDSFNSGAGMNRLLVLAAFAKANMPPGASFDVSVLSDEDAYDVAGFIVSQPRPAKASLDRDFPVRLEKPVDASYGPYADGFSEADHRLGPFAPIRAKVQAMLGSGSANAPGAGGADDASAKVNVPK
jgi:thiosulfate dehydrogenase